jgi:hypothetical protein
LGFGSLEQRLAHTYLDTFPEFEPSKNGCSVTEQETFYKLMQNLYQLAYDEPDLFVSQLHEDDAYMNRFNKSAEGKPELDKNMRFFTKSVDELLNAMFQMGTNRNTVKLSKRQNVILRRLGVNEAGVLPAAWVWMAARQGAGILAFSKCLFDQNHSYARAVFARLLGDTVAFHRLEQWVTGHGYTRFDNLHGQLSIDFANLSWDKNIPTGGFQFKIRHTGISISYDKSAKEPPILGLCIPNGLKDCLNSFQDMDEGLKKFVISRTKKCDSCNFCIQTDKTKTRPRAFIPIKYNSNTVNLCPLFPGYSYFWSSINDELVNDLIAMMSFMDNKLKRKQNTKA